MKKIVICLLLLAISIVLTGCGSSNKSKTNDNHTIKNIAGKDVTIEKGEITHIATYYNYLAEDGVTIQLFAVRGTDDIIRVLFNTCGSCNPSPTAYFVQEGDYFVCQNCGNRFHMDDIGLEKDFGCSPIAILDDNKIIDNDTITISSKFIETYKDKFTSINIYEN